MGSSVSATFHDAHTTRAGEDARRRGWFWHWNAIITQYAPLIGLKGVGLLNSYTVWTDRREESPHRGYAFPSQQAEADFYGEDRAELITINKILTALDLIEIRKEMLPRTDSQGRRWKVPHNLYRVKDRPDGVGLRAADVLRVVELAERDEDVYRYVRRIFSGRFAPIDRDNVWHAILDELSGDPRWEAMRARAAEQEAKASARSRAGHDTRAGRAGRGQPRAIMTSGQNSTNLVGRDVQEAAAEEPASGSVAQSTNGSNTGQTTVARSNNGCRLVVAGSNEGVGGDALGIVATSNAAAASDVGQSNTTYDQGTSTTTTTTGLPALAGEIQRGAHLPADSARAGQHDHHEPSPPVLADGLPVHTPGEAHLAASAQRCDPPSLNAEVAGVARSAALADRGTPVSDACSVATPPLAAGPVPGRAADPPGRPDPLGHLGPADGLGPVGDPHPLVVSLFEAANDRPARPLERQLLAELERAADPPARAAGCSGSDLVAAAIREAVSSGSTFVAPKRIQEIVARWIAEGQGPLATRRGAPAAPPSAGHAALTPTGQADAAPLAPVRLPGGRSGAAVWQAVLADLAGVLGPDAFARLLADSAIVRYRQGCVEVRVGSIAAADKLAAEYHALVSRRLNERLPRPVDLRFVPADDAPLECAPPATTAAPAPPLDHGVVISRADADVGRQLWRSILFELDTVLGPDDRERLADILPLAQDAAGRLLLGAPTRYAARLLDHRYRADIERACSRMLNRPVVIHPLDPADWSVGDA